MFLKLGLFSILSLSTAAAVTSQGCGADTVERIYDCDQICDKYKECADANYDDDACADKCRDNAEDSDAYQDKADDCEDCIDSRSCVDSAFQCSDQCAGIVP